MPIRIKNISVRNIVCYIHIKKWILYRSDKRNLILQGFFICYLLRTVHLIV